MKLRKIMATMLVIVMLLSAFSVSISAFTIVSLFPGEGYSNIVNNIYMAEMEFVDGVGPETDGIVIDYKYYSPVKADDTTKYPLVIWCHGSGNGLKTGSQLSASDVEAWATEELQSRFKGTEGAFIFAPRSPENKGVYWGDKTIYPLKVVIDDFIAQHIDNIDLSRIYIGGYSLGGKMTLKMAVAYPEMFAAAFPICPAWVPDEAAAEKIADMPIWLTSGKKDNVVNYKLMPKRAWKNIISKSNLPEECRFSTLTRTAEPDWSKTHSPHHAWISVNYDMFSSRDGDYPYMKTVDGNGNKIKLTYPNGMISWLSEKTSDYDGTITSGDRGNSEAYDNLFTMESLKKIVAYIEDVFAKIFN